MRLVGDSSITTPKFIITSVSLVFLTIFIKIGLNVLLRDSEEAMPMFKKILTKINEVIWVFGVNMTSGVVLA